MKSKKLDLLQSLLLAIAITAHFLLISPLYILVINYSEYPNSTFNIIAKALLAVTCIGVPFLTLATYVQLRIGWYRSISLLLALTLYLYMQFHFFTWNYGIFDGRQIVWSDYSFANFIEIPVLALLCILAAVFPRKFYSHALFVLLLLFLGESTFTAFKYIQLQPTLKTSEAGQSTSPRIIDYFTANEDERLRANILSSEQNVFVILVDTLQSDFFEKIIMENPSIRKKMEGFVFFRNSSGFFPYTTLTLPAIFTGQPYQPGEILSNYYKRVKDDRIDTILGGKGFSLSTIPMSSSARMQYISSISERSYSLASIFDIVLFRHAPNYMKPIVFNEYKFLLRPYFLTEVPDTRPELDVEVLKSLAEHSFVRDHQGEFKFMHLWGMHPPSMLNRDCKVMKASHKGADIENQAYCIITMVVKYFERLKELGVYDKSLILLIADTGSKYPITNTKKENRNTNIPEFVMSSAHPLIAVKDFNQRGEMRTSDAPVSLMDIKKTILSSLKMSSENMEGFDLLSIKEDQERERSFFYYKGSEEAVRGGVVPQVQEFIINGFIRDISSWSVGKFYSSLQSGNDIMNFVDFGQVESSRFQDLGWSVETKGFISSWTITKTAALIGKLPMKESVRMTARLTNPHPEQKVEIRVNGRWVALWDIAKPHGYREYSTLISLPEIERNAVSRVEFIVDKFDTVNDRDERKLGIYVDWIRFE